MSFFTRVLPMMIMTPAGIYFMFVFRRFLRLFPVFSSTGGMIAVGWGLSAAFGAIFIIMAGNIRSTGVVIGLYFLLACLLLQVVHIFWKNPTAYALTLVIAGAMTAAVILFGYVNMHIVHEETYELSSTKLKDDVTVAFISDLHLGVNMDADGLKEYLDSVSEKNPDMLLLGGDIFDEGTKKEEMEKACKYFGETVTKYGIYYVYGNHDQNRYVQDKQYTRSYMDECLENAGVKILEDESVKLENGIELIGLSDRSIRSESALPGLIGNDGSFTLVMDHQPVECEEKAALGADLLLSGHTHGGQIWPLGIYNELVSDNDMNYGMRKFGDMTAIVSSGIAGWRYSIRTEKNCEYLIITLKAVKED